LGFYVFMLVGAAREITSFWQAKAQTAVLEDRRRIARDLHDGVIQELSYIYAQSRRLTADPGDALAVQRIGGAAGRAIDESRRALAALTRADDADLPVVLRQALDELAARYDVKVVMAADADADAEGDGPIVEALLRVQGEAVRNAVRHGKATRVDVHLTAAPLSLTVRDDGRGFPAHLPDGGRSGGFGLTSMRERASSVGATLTIDSEPGKGTTVRVSWV
jgi:signal transduction histidine kinase